MVPQKSPVPGVCLHPGLFMGKKRIRLFGYFYVAFRPHQRTKKYYFLHLCKLEETGGNSTLSLIPQMCTWQDHPRSTELSADRLKLHLPLLFQDICFSLCRIYYYSAVSSQSFWLLDYP